MALKNLFVLAAAALGWSLVSAEARALEDWNTVVAKAKQEGLVVVHGAPGRSYADVMVKAFNKAYPEIRVKFSGASNRVDVPKLLRERKAEIYAWDVWVSGPSTAVARLKPRGIFQPLRDYLRPETMEDRYWHGGFDAGWMDNEKKFFYAFEGTVQNPISVNWDFVKKEQITSIKDLLKPEFAGKIVWHDPRYNGSGNGASQTVEANFGEDFLRALLKQKIVFTTNRRQVADWVVRGRHPIALGLDENDVAVFQEQGLGKNIGALPDSFYKVQQLSSGFGGVGIVDRAPHPNAAAVYVNWLLGKEGQQEWAKVPRNSRRLDVEAVDKTLMPHPGVVYFNGQTEENAKKRLHLQEVAKQVIGVPVESDGKKSRKKKGGEDE
jgi:iron(III) transport system substrate-binding protein